jgi:hypothetical protein
MNDFENRWKMGAEAARRAGPSVPSEEALLGFATRVVARWQAQPEISLPALWQWLALRVLGVMALILLTLAAYGALSLSGDAPLQPPVENAVGDSLWLL